MSDVTPGPGSLIEQITTQWSRITDPVQFVMRYAAAIRRYLGALLGDPHLRDDVQQEFLLNLMRKGPGPSKPLRGRFRDYLKACLRNAARTHLRKKRPAQATDLQLQALADDAPADSPAERAWAQEWRKALVAQALERLRRHQEERAGSLAHDVFRLTMKHPKVKSPQLVGLLEEQTGRRLTPEALRQQLSRARKLFAQFLADEVGQTLQSPEPGDLEEELADLGLLELVRPYLEP